MYYAFALRTGSPHRVLCITYYVLRIMHYALGVHIVYYVLRITYYALCITHWESTSSIMYYVLRITYYVLRTRSPHRMLCIMYYVLCMMRHTLRISDKHTMCVCWLLRFMCSQRAHAHIMKIYSDSIHSSVDRDGNRNRGPCCYVCTLPPMHSHRDMHPYRSNIHNTLAPIHLRICKIRRPLPPSRVAARECITQIHNT